MRSAGKQERGQSRSYESRIKNASTSSVDKSVHEERVTAFLSYQAATPNLIAYCLGIESRHLDTTRYGMEDFPSISRIQLVTERACQQVTYAANYVAHDQCKAVIHIASGLLH